MKKIDWFLVSLGAAALLLAGSALVPWRAKERSTIDKPPVTQLTVSTPVKIVAVQETDSMMRYGASGCTTIEYTNGLRRQIGGIYGKVGDTFMILTDPKWLE